MKIGIYQVYWGRVGGGQRYIGKVAEVLSRSHEVEIVHHHADFDRVAAEEAMDLDLSRVSFRFLSAEERPVWVSRNPLKRLERERAFRSDLSRPYDLFIESSDIPPPFCHARRGALLVHFPLVTFEEFHGHDSDAWRRRPRLLRWMAERFHRWEWRERFGSYQLSVVNADYTRRWLKRLWGLESTVLNPPLRNDLVPRLREPIILSIGAFRGAAHKKQDVMVETFKCLCDRGLADWRYVLVGACGDDTEGQAYLNDLRRRASGYPIEFRPDASGMELQGLLERSSILWHSMGYGVDQERDPRLLEHFGMVAAEAMAAGAVPVVFDGGGLREIVDQGRTGFLWSTTEELADLTESLIRNPDLRERLRTAAIAESRRYSTEAFEVRLHEVLAPVLR